MKHRLFVFFLAAFFSFSAHNICFSQDPLKQHSFEFKGYKLELKSMATDDSGNYLFCGYIQSDESIAEKDTAMQARLDKFTLFSHDEFCIILQTDQTFSVKDVFIFVGLFPSNLVYDPENKLFWMGASRLNYRRDEKESLSYWEMLMVKIDLNKKEQLTYLIETDFSCRMNEITLIRNGLTCVCIKETGKNEERLEVPAVVEVSTTLFHRNPDFPFISSPEIYCTTVSPVNQANHVMITDLAANKNGFYFAANRFPFGQTSTLGMDVYYYEDGRLTSRPFYPSQETNGLPNVTNIQRIGDDHNLLISYVPKYNGKYFILEKLTNPRFDTIYTITVPDLQYPDFYNELLVLPNGKIVVAGLNAQKTWSYFVYSADGTLEKEIDTKMSKDLVIGFTKAFTDNNFVCLFRSNSKATANQLFVYSTN